MEEEKMVEKKGINMDGWVWKVTLVYIKEINNNTIIRENDRKVIKDKYEKKIRKKFLKNRKGAIN